MDAAFMDKAAAIGVEFGVVADGAYWHYAIPSKGGWKHYAASDLPEVADLLDKFELSDEDWQRIHAAMAAFDAAASG